MRSHSLLDASLATRGWCLAPALTKVVGPFEDHDATALCHIRLHSCSLARLHIRGETLDGTSNHSLPHPTTLRAGSPTSRRTPLRPRWTMQTTKRRETHRGHFRRDTAKTWNEFQILQTTPHIVWLIPSELGRKLAVCQVSKLIQSSGRRSDPHTSDDVFSQTSHSQRLPPEALHVQKRSHSTKNIRAHVVAERVTVAIRVVSITSSSASTAKKSPHYRGKCRTGLRCPPSQWYLCASLQAHCCGCCGCCWSC